MRKFIIFIVLNIALINASYAADNPLQKAVAYMKVNVALAKMAAEDQAVRNGLMQLQDEGHDLQVLFNKTDYINFMQNIDRENTRQLKVIINRYGWPDSNRFGAETDANAWLIVQHADFDLPFQKKVLELLQGALKKEATSLKNYAYLWDRVQVNGGKPQRYGTQGSCLGKNSWRARPLENPAQVDRLRAEVGLNPLADYAKQAAEHGCH